MTTALPKSHQWKLGTLALIPYDIDVTHNVTIAGSLSVAGVITASAGSNSGRQTIAAAGSTVTDAAQLKVGFNSVTAADGTKGVKLPATPVAGTRVTVKSVTGGSVLKVWPDAAATINAIGSNSSISMASLTCCEFIADSTTQWYTLPLLPS